MNGVVLVVDEKKAHGKKSQKIINGKKPMDKKIHRKKFKYKYENVMYT